MQDILQHVVRAIQQGEPIAVLTVVRASGSTPRHLTSSMMVHADGAFIGSIGGGTMELRATLDARAAIEEKKSRLVDYNLTDKTPGNVGLCGGTEQVFIDVILPGN
jgi:xanthine dehydrogenase accessory factor